MIWERRTRIHLRLGGSCGWTCGIVFWGLVRIADVELFVVAEVVYYLRSNVVVVALVESPFPLSVGKHLGSESLGLKP